MLTVVDQQNAHIAAFNGRLRDECPNVHQFVSLGDAREKIEAWRVDYDLQRPRGALGHLRPSELVTHRQDTRIPQNGASL